MRDRIPTVHRHIQSVAWGKSVTRSPSSPPSGTHTHKKRNWRWVTQSRRFHHTAEFPILIPTKQNCFYGSQDSAKNENTIKKYIYKKRGGGWRGSPLKTVLWHPNQIKALSLIAKLNKYQLWSTAVYISTAQTVYTDSDQPSSKDWRKKRKKKKKSGKKKKLDKTPCVDTKTN